MTIWADKRNENGKVWLNYLARHIPGKQAQSLGSYWTSLPSLAPGLQQVMLGMMLIGDGCTNRQEFDAAGGDPELYLSHALDTGICGRR